MSKPSVSTTPASPVAAAPMSLLRRLFFAIVLLAALAGLAWLVLTKKGKEAEGPGGEPKEGSAQSFKLGDNDIAGLSFATVEQHRFRTEIKTDGKISIDEDSSTPVYSPYSGYVGRLAVKPGDQVKAGQLLFTIEALDMVQAQNDFLTARAALTQAKAQLDLAVITEKRQHDLFDAKAAPQKDWQQSQADLVAAQSNLRAAEVALEAVRNRLRVLKKTEQEIADFDKTGSISAETPIYAPIAGTIIQRKVGPHQFITTGGSDPSGDPVFVIGDLSTVWLITNVPELDAGKVKVGNDLEFKVVSDAKKTGTGQLSYVTDAIDPNTRRLAVRATVSNPDKSLKPEMFATVTIFADEGMIGPAIPRQSIIYEGDKARVWIVKSDKTLELRNVKLGLATGDLVQVLEGLSVGEKIVVTGALFIDRAGKL